MNSEAEMRAVILHAAEKLEAAKDAKIKTGYNEWSHMPASVLLSMGYAEGILRLLASYLKVDPDQRADATPEPGWTGQQPNGHRPPDPAPQPVKAGGRAVEKVERNAAVVAAIQGGE
jgi:hypothetical protein